MEFVGPGNGRWRWLLLAFFALQVCAAPDTLVLTQDEITSSFARQVDVLANAPITMTPEDALNSPLLTSYPEELVNLGPQVTPAWLRFQVRNGSGEWGAWVLNTLRSNVEVMEIYKAGNQGIELLFDNGNDEQRRESLKRYFNLVAPLNLAPDESATVLIRFQAAVSGWLPMRAIPTSMLTSFTFSQFSLFIVTTAGTGILILYNLLLFLFTRDTIYVLYTVATAALLLACLHLQGMTTAWWFYASPEWGRTFGATASNLSGLLLLTFARKFLALRGRRAADIWYWLAAPTLLLHLIALPVSMLVLPTMTDLLVMTAWTVATITYVSLPLQAFFAHRGRRTEEILLGVAWTILASQFVTFLLSGAGILRGGNMDWYLLGPACFIEAAMVAVSIALRVRRLQHEKDAADARSTTALQDMNERARLILAASHDARNLVSGARSLSDRVQEAPELSRAKADARKAAQLLDSLEQTMNVMVSHSRQVGPGTIPMIETINVAEILETLVLTFREFGAEHSKRITWRSNLESVAGDRYMLTRVLSNLIKNAILYSRGERVLIVCRGFEDHVDFRVYDQGPGMSAADLARVLNHDRSMRLSLQTQGIGIGLRNCAKLAASYGGELEAASRSDGGSMFGLRLPTPGLSAIRKPLNFLGDKRVWQSYAAVLDKGRLVDTHNGKADELYVFTENVEIQSSAGINVVACVDRSSENRDKWARVADAMLCFPITLPALAYAVWLASRRSSLEVSS